MQKPLQDKGFLFLLLFIGGIFLCYRSMTVFAAKSVLSLDSVDKLSAAVLTALPQQTKLPVSAAPTVQAILPANGNQSAQSPKNTADQTRSVLPDRVLPARAGGLKPAHGDDSYYSRLDQCPLNDLLSILAKSTVTVEEKSRTYQKIKYALQNPNCVSCVSKEKYIDILYNTARQKLGWPKQNDLRLKEMLLRENGLLKKELSLYADSACVFHKNYGYTPDLLSIPQDTPQSPEILARNPAYQIDPIDLSQLGSVYQRELSPNL